MDDTNTTQSNIEKAESVANIVQAVVNKVAEKYGGNIALAFSNVLTGNGAVVTSLGVCRKTPLIQATFQSMKNKLKNLLKTSKML